MTGLTFGHRIGLGFGFLVVLAVVIAALAAMSLNAVVAAKDAVITGPAQVLIDVQELNTAVAEKSAAGRAFLLIGDANTLREVEEADTQTKAHLAVVANEVQGSEGQALVRAVRDALEAHRLTSDGVFALKRGGAPPEAVTAAWDREMSPRRNAADAAMQDLVDYANRGRADAMAEATTTAQRAQWTLFGIALFAVAAALGIAVPLSRSLSSQIGGAVGHIQSSAAELQAVSTQQATGSREQSTAMTEINTTMSELLATSRQIAESAQRVTQIADQTGAAARSGQGTVARAQESVLGIRRQVDLIVQHTTELGRKSQQIGAVVDIVGELAEQTNILAINATIEAAGAGESGKRFGVVADEIRKLADRVAAATKEIRGLVDDVRGAVNTTVMATETGSKSVDGGARQVGEVTQSFGDIARLVSTTTEAAREIELSTKQQASAVEQVNAAIGGAAQATRETESGATQTLQTASQLASLSRELLQIVQPRAGA